MRARTLLLTPLLVATLGLAGCAETADEESGPTSTPTPTATGGAGETPSGSITPTPDPSQVVEITLEDGRATPNGSTVKVDQSAPVILEITADEPGELHVHTSPEREIAYPAGTSRHELTLHRPGVFEVESHDLHLVIVKLQAS